ncbi:MAG: peptide ABC transporter substrate-binding protein [Herpetosiphonaceae bacterium]|nr:peptide ABC transporter substrate-binding protein [Herpetosiphonaceae bacterium]
MFKRLLCALLVAVLLVACGGQNAAPDPTDIPTTPPLEVPQGGTLTIRLARDVGPLLPWQPASHEEEQITSLLYRGLTRLDATLAPQPDIASAWQSDATGRTLTMTLRTDLRWHDGTPLTAADALWTINTLRVLSPTTTLLADLRNVLTSVQTPVSDTLVLSLSEPYAPILAALSTPILPEHIFGARPPAQLVSTDFWQEAVGSGPFVFEDRRPGTSLTLIRNADYADGVPYLDRVAFVVAPDPAVASEALGQGDLLAAELPWTVSAALSDTQSTTPALQFGAYAENGFYYLALNNRLGRAFSDSRVRAALAIALDRDEIAQLANNGAIPILSDHLPGTWAASEPAPIARPNLERARQLLNEAGWILPAESAIRASNGITLSAPLYVRGDDERRVRVAERIASVARQVGINLVVTPSDFESVIRSKLAPPFDFDIALMSWSNSRVRPDGPSYAAYDPDNFALFHSSQIYQGVADGRAGLRNYIGFRDSSFDNLSTAARALYDTERRRDLYRQTNEIIANSQPYMFLWADQVPVVLSTQVRSTQGEINLNTPNWLDGVQHWYLER